MAFRAVIFDLGGVVLPSPLDVFRAYEARHGLPHRFLSEVVIDTGDHGAWSRFERGELDAGGFAAAFEVEGADAGGVAVVADLLSQIATRTRPHPELLPAFGEL